MRFHKGAQHGVHAGLIAVDPDRQQFLWWFGLGMTTFAVLNHFLSRIGAASWSVRTACSISRSVSASTRFQSVLPGFRVFRVRLTIFFAFTSVSPPCHRR